MQTICMSAWNHKVSHNCLHALLEAGYRKPRDIAFVRVSRLLRIPEVDANDVASMLFALNDAVFNARNISCPPGSFDLTREELAERVRKLCKEYRLDSKPKKLLSLTAIELIKIANHDMAVIPQMVRKIKHFMLGKPDPEALLSLPSIQKKEPCEGRWWAASSDAPDAKWEDQLRDEEYENQADPSYDCCDDLPVIHQRKCVRKIPIFC